MDVRTERVDSAVVLRLEGRLGVESDGGWMRDAVIAVASPGVRHAVLDLGTVSSLDCSGIGQLLQLRERVHGARRTFCLVCVERHQKRMLERSGLLHVFRVFGDCDAAMSALGIRATRAPARTPEPAVAIGYGTPGTMATCWSTAAG